jgi:hypothetical protein
MRKAALPYLMMTVFLLVISTIIAHPAHPDTTPHPLRSRVAEAVMLAAFLLSLASLFVLGNSPPAPRPERRGPDLLLLLMLAAFETNLALQILFGIDIANRIPPLQKMAAIIFAASGAAALAWFSFVPSDPRRWERTRALCRPLLFVMIGAGAALKAAAIIFEPVAMIDVWHVLQNGSAVLAGGQNPYSTYDAAAESLGRDFGNPVTTYVYPPSILLLTHPFARLAGDVRWLYLLGDLASAALFIVLGRRLRGGDRTARYCGIAALLVIFHPVSFGKTWTDTIILPFMLACVMIFTARPSGWAAPAAAGFMLSIKQYLVFFAPIWAFRIRKPAHLFAAAAAAAATTAPFVLWDAGALFRSVVQFHFNTPFRSDGLTFASLSSSLFGFLAPSWLGAVVALLLSLHACLLGRNRGLTGIFVWAAPMYLGLFFFSGYAFINYYHFVTGVILCGVILAASEIQPLSARDCNS